MTVGRAKLSVPVLAILASGVAGCGGNPKHAASTAAASTVPSPSPVYLECESATRAAGAILQNAYDQITPTDIERLISSGEREAANGLRQASQKLDAMGGTSARLFAVKLNLLAEVLIRLSSQAAAAHGSTPPGVLGPLTGAIDAVGKICPNSS